MVYVEQAMNNTNVETLIWKRFKKNWAELDANAQDIEIEFKLIINGDDKEKTLAIDVIQKIDDEIFTETVQRVAGEVYKMLGISGLSKEHLVEIYKEKLHTLQNQANRLDTRLIVTMKPTSPISGEVKAYFDEQEKNQKDYIQVDYQHYYLLNAIWDKMVDLAGSTWSQVKAVYWKNTLEFYFEH